MNHSYICLTHIYKHSLSAGHWVPSQSEWMWGADNVLLYRNNSTASELELERRQVWFILCCFSALTHRSACISASSSVKWGRVGGSLDRLLLRVPFWSDTQRERVLWSSSVSLCMSEKHYFPYCAWNQKDHVWVPKSYQVLASSYIKSKLWQFLSIELLRDLKGEP